MVFEVTELEVPTRLSGKIVGDPFLRKSGKLCTVKVEERSRIARVRSMVEEGGGIGCGWGQGMEQGFTNGERQNLQVK